MQMELDMNLEHLRECKHCKNVFPATTTYFNKKQFTQDGRTFDGLDHRCKDCYVSYQRQMSNLRKGLSYLPLHITEAYNKSCWCCGKEDVPLHNDHLNGGGFRGKLCKGCNNNLGKLGDTYDKAVKNGADDMYLDYLMGAELRLGKGV